MNYYILIPLTSLLVELFIFAYILGQESKNKINSAYLLIAGSIIFWLSLDAIAWTADENSQTLVRFLYRSASFAWILLGFLFLNFTYVFIDKKRDAFYYAGFILGIICIGINLSTNWIQKDFEKLFWGWAFIHNFLFVPVVFFVITVPFSYSFLLIYKKMKNTERRSRKNQYNLVLYGAAAALIIGLLFDVVFPAMEIRDIPQLSAAPVVIHTVFIFFAIGKSRLFNIGLSEAANDLFSGIRSAMLLLDNEANIIMANNAAKEMLNITVAVNHQSEDDLTANDIQKIIPEYSFDQSYKDSEIVLLRGQKPMYLSMSQSPLHENREEIGKILIIRDITKAKIAEMEIFEKNKKITESITYAKRIQQAILPKEEALKGIFPESFIFYKPRDIVSGDFYWYSTVEDQDGSILYMIAAVDCTGHGVPGAFMSMIGNSLLNKIVNENNIYCPAMILQQMDNGVIDALHRHSEDKRGQYDGMDISICSIKIKQNGKLTAEIEFAGVNQFLYVIKDGQIEKYKGDFHSIGSKFVSKGREFKTHKITAEAGSVIYLFSDGYKDQFGGSKNSRFTYSRFDKLLLGINHLSMNEQRENIKNAFEEWRDSYRQLDDVLVMGIRF